MAISEYGAGGSLGQSMPSPDYRPKPGGKYHPVDYQFVWVMFDTGSDSRREGARDGINDKGLVCFDHKTVKPAYLFYQKEWQTTEEKKGAER